MALQVNVFGNQLGAADLISPEERIQNILYAQETNQNFLDPVAAASRASNVEGTPSYFDNSNIITGGTQNSPNQAFDTGASLVQPRNKADLKTRQSQQIFSSQQAQIRRPVLGQNEKFTPEVQEWIDLQTQLTGVNPVDNLTDQQIAKAKQTGLITVPGGIKHLTSEEQISGKEGGLPTRAGDLARFFSPSYNPEDIVGMPNSNEPSLIPTGAGGVAQRAPTNREGNLGAWTPMDRALVIDKVKWLRGVREKVEQSIFTASNAMPVAGQPASMTEFGRMLEQEFGVGASTNPSLAGIMTAAYYSALNESRFAKYSQEQEQEFELYREKNEGKNDPTLWETNVDGREAQTPMLEVLTEAIGSSMEAVGGFKFSSPAMKSFVSDTVRKTFANLGSGVSLTVAETKYMGEDTGPFFQTFSLADVEEGRASNFSPIRGISFNKTLGKQQLGEIMGIINALQPGKRKNADYVPPAKLALDKKDPMQARSISGVSSVRNSYINIMQAMPNKLDPYVTNLLASLVYQNEEWNHIISNIIKIKEDGVNIMLQQYQDIKNNGGIFYQRYMQQQSGRHAAMALAGMQNLNGQRIATIPITPELLKLSSETDPDKYNQEESDFVAAAMAQLGYNKWGDNLQGNDNLRYSAILRRFKQLLDPKHPIRTFQEKMLAFEKELRTNPKADAKDFGIDYADGKEFLTDKDSMQALWSLNEFLKAKEQGKNEFLDPYVTGLDSQQNGLFGIGVIMGDIKATKSGGARTKGANSNFFKDETGLLEEDKTYMTTLGMARSIFLQQIQDEDNQDLAKFAELFFVNAQSDKELANLFQKEFAKKVVVGGQYGQMEKASAQSMRIGFLEWLERVDNPLSEEKIRDTIMSDINEWGGVGGSDVNYLSRSSTSENLEEIKPIIYFKKNFNDDRMTNKIAVEGKALDMMTKIAEIFNFAMHKAAPGISDYTSKMKDIYTTMVELAGYSQDWNLDLINGVELRIREPDVTDPSKPIYTKEGYANNWSDENGIRINLLDNAVEDKWVSIPMEGWLLNEQTGIVESDAAWEERKIWLRRGSNSYSKNLAQEREALDFNSPLKTRSAGLTRAPVVSLHVLDDLAMAITVHELKRKYGDEFDWFNSIWDEGKIRKQFRERFADEYNKAWMAVLLENNYFKQMSDAFSTAMRNIPPEHMVKIKGNQRAMDALEILQEQVDGLVHAADEILTGNHDRGNVHQIIKNYDANSTQNMSSNTKNRENKLTKKEGMTVVDTTPVSFGNSAVAGLHPGLMPGRTQKDILDYYKTLKR